MTCWRGLPPSRPEGREAERGRIAENLVEEELAVFDLLTKPEMKNILPHI
jgi:hypothetical protein